MLKAKVKIKGIAPILFNRFPDEDNVDGQVRRKTAPLTKSEQVEKSLYKTGKGKIFTPSDHLVGALVKAAVNFKMEGKKTFKDAAKGGIFVEPMEIVHKNQNYTTDWRSIVNPNTRGRSMKGRGRLDKWELEFDLICIDLRVTKKDLEEMLKYAGQYIGIGDYRPRYGRFEVTKFTVVSN